MAMSERTPIFVDSDITLGEIAAALAAAGLRITVAPGDRWLLDRDPKPAQQVTP